MMVHPWPRVAVVGTGGTIELAGASRVDLAWYAETGRRLADCELVDSVPELREVAEIEPTRFRRLSSYGLTTGDWLDLARTVNALLWRADIDGVVVTHGTNTLEETAYFLHLVVGSDKPVVLVGAMRPVDTLGADGGLNLLRAVQVAASPRARGEGVLAVLDDTVFAARDVTKTATYRTHAFQAPDSGPLGYADVDGVVVLYHRHTRQPAHRPAFACEHLEALPRVDVLLSYVGADGVLVDAAVAAGARGLVSAGTGAGLPTPGERDALVRARERGVAVCQASRVGSGRVSRSPCLREHGIVAADNLQPWKAKVLLSLALTQTNETEELQELFDLL